MKLLTILGTVLWNLSGINFGASSENVIVVFGKGDVGTVDVFGVKLHTGGVDIQQRFWREAAVADSYLIAQMAVNFLQGY